MLEDRNFKDTLHIVGDVSSKYFAYMVRTPCFPAQDISTANQGTVLDVTEQFFTTATFKEGFLDISIENQLPVEAELIEFELLNDDDKSVVVQGTILKT